ncbi:MAG: PD40 domain-containing protein [Armatimonadetes bacterium]|nr:PD40 domain-containing protein [Armatimonadota bacterium]
MGLFTIQSLAQGGLSRDSDDSILFPQSSVKIAFTSERDGNAEIYVMNADGSGQTRLTNNGADDRRPAFSPDGSKIAFASDRDGNWEIYVMNADGSGQTRLTNHVATDHTPAFSPDGSKIAFGARRDGDFEIYIMNVDGTDQTRLTNSSLSDWVPAFSPDGSKIVFASWREGNDEIYVMNVDGSGQTNLTHSGTVDFDPSYSPDGSKITFLTTRDGNWEIYVMNADGTGATRLTNNGSVDVDPVYSPDGSKIAFNSDRDGDHEIYIMNADGTGAIQLTNNAAFDGQPSFQTLHSTVIPPDSFSLFRGILIAGGLSDLFSSDNLRMFVRPGITLNQAERQVQLIVVGTAPTETPTVLRFRVEAHASINNIGQWIDLWNYDTNSYEQVDFMIATTADSVVEVTITTDPSRFIENGTLAMQARVSYKEVGIVLSYPWLIILDQTVWVVVD